MCKKVISSFVAAFIFSGCSMFHSEPPKNEGQVVHVVTYPGENLGKIATWYTGSKDNWREIERNNPNVSTKRLRLGDRILIPNRLLKKTAAMPQAFVAGRQGKDLAKNSSSSSAKVKTASAVKIATKKIPTSEKSDAVKAISAVPVKAEKVQVPVEPAAPAIEETIASAEEVSVAPDESSKSQKFVCIGESCDGLKAKTALLPPGSRQ